MALTSPFHCKFLGYMLGGQLSALLTSIKLDIGGRDARMVVYARAERVLDD